MLSRKRTDTAGFFGVAKSGACRKRLGLYAPASCLRLDKADADLLFEEVFADKIAAVRDGCRASGYAIGSSSSARAAR